MESSIEQIVHPKIIISLNDNSDDDISDILDISHVQDPKLFNDSEKNMEVHKIQALCSSHLPKKEIDIFCKKAHNAINITEEDDLYLTNFLNYLTKIQISENNDVVLIPVLKTSLNASNLIWIKVPRICNYKILNFLRKIKVTEWINTDITYDLISWFETYKSEINKTITIENLFDYDIQQISYMMEINKIGTWKNYMNQEFISKSLLVNICDFFYIVGYSYFKNDEKLIGLCGLTIFYCNHSTNNNIQILQIASIKLTPNYNNNAYDSIERILMLDNSAPIFIYTKENSQTEAFFTTNAYAFSKIFYCERHRIKNLIGFFKMKKNITQEIKHFCIDKQIHRTICSHCNTLSMLLSLSGAEYYLGYLLQYPRIINIPITKWNTDIGDPNPEYRICMHVCFISYGKHAYSKYTNNCACMKTKPNLELNNYYKKYLEDNICLENDILYKNDENMDIS
uniref:Uncharacterized protein n=1 Tax=Faxonius propinquus nudivirus TaxID=3139431 RepID=A0AAU8GE84_9VIRU